MELFLQGLQDFDHLNSRGSSALHLAIYNRNEAAAHTLLWLGASAHVQDSCRWTPLALAVMLGQESVATTLLNRGADPNIADIYGRTSLHHATWARHARLVGLLLDHGADPNVREADHGLRPVAIAIGQAMLNVGSGGVLDVFVARGLVI